MVILPIKKKWYDMILSGEKKEEYREIKPYYTTRFKNENMMDGSAHDVLFRNGYSSTSPSFMAKCRLRVGTGNSNWGAVPDTEYYVLCVEKVERDNSGKAVYY